MTYVFVTGLDPISFLFDLLVLYFFAGWFERSFGAKRFVRFFFLAAVGAHTAGEPVAAALRRILHHNSLQTMLALKARLEADNGGSHELFQAASLQA